MNVMAMESSGPGEALLFASNGFGIHEPLGLSGAARLLFLDAAKAADFQKTANVSARSIEKSGCFLSGKPAGIRLGHLEFSSRDKWGGRFTVAVAFTFWQSKKE